MGESMDIKPIRYGFIIYSLQTLAKLLTFSESSFLIYITKVIKISHSVHKLLF